MQKIVITDKGLQLSKELFANLDQEETPWLADGKPVNPGKRSPGNNQRPFFLKKYEIVPSYKENISTLNKKLENQRLLIRTQ